MITGKINVGKTELHYEYIRDLNKRKTIIFESGYGWDLGKWDPIISEVSKFANIFMYDRDGIGKSGKSEQPKHSLQIVKNLKNLLQMTKVKPPYVLVGHSFGGAIVRLFASLYPNEVEGIILLDSVHEDQNKKMVPLFTNEVQDMYLGQFGVEASLDEFEESLEQVRGTKLGDIPLSVMTGGTQSYHTEESMDVWIGFQKELANLSSQSKHIIIEDAGHAIHIDRPQPVIDAIREMMCER